MRYIKNLMLVFNEEGRLIGVGRDRNIVFESDQIRIEFMNIYNEMVDRMHGQTKD